MSAFDPNACGGCSGLDAETPARIGNPPGQRAIAYRSGVHASFKESLLARLSSSELPALAGLSSRDGGDFTIALCDALATTLDVLTFYQERIANENYLRTATERRSILELARLIGYRLAPGVAAQGHLTFTLQEVPGSPALAAGPVEIPIGTRVQSVPGPGEQAQTFETVEAVEARAEWNAIPVQAGEAWRPRSGDLALWLAGVGHALQPGDTILIVGQERLMDKDSKQWSVRVLAAVEEDRTRQRTRLSWDAPLGEELASAGVTVSVFRQRAALFGHNAPDPRMLNTTDTLIGESLTSDKRDWSNFKILNDQIDLDGEYPKIIAGSWLALRSTGLRFVARPPEDLRSLSRLSSSPFSGGTSVTSLFSERAATALRFTIGRLELFRVQSVSHLSRRDYGLSAKITRVQPDLSPDPTEFTIRETLALAQSEELPVSERPLSYPLYGESLALGRLAPGLGPGRALGVSGKRARVRLRKGESKRKLALEAGGSVAIQELDSLRLLAAPEQKSGKTWTVISPPDFGALLKQRSRAELRLRLLDRDGQEGVLEIEAAAVELVPAAAKDEDVQEIAFVAAATSDRDRSTFTLAAPLQHVYDRDSARVNANAARATHGETVQEILGSGDARVPNASLPLRQAPLTFVSAATPSGRRSTLELRANDLLWQEVPSLYGCGPDQRVYELAIDDQARTTVRIGDGLEGARLPSGDHNLRARYRKGLGLAGNVAAGSLSNLLSRPLGLTGASNPEAASGGADPESTDQARDNAPLTVLTLDRAVSIRDYQNFAQAFAGIAKAHALWIPSGPARGVFLTVAGEEGAAVPASSDTHRYLLEALQRYGDPLMPLRLVSYRDARFRLRLAVKVAGDAEASLVLAAVEARLRETFGFAARSFGQGVSLDEAAAAAQAVAGVVAVHVMELHRTEPPPPKLLEARLHARLPVASLTALPPAAELLTLDAAALAVEPLP